jgi:hypothetical protein
LDISHLPVYRKDVVILFVLIPLKLFEVDVSEVDVVQYYPNMYLSARLAVKLTLSRRLSLKLGLSSYLRKYVQFLVYYNCFIENEFLRHYKQMYTPMFLIYTSQYMKTCF